MVGITLLTASSTSLPVVVGVVSGPDFLSTWPGVIILSFLHYCRALMMAHSQCGCLSYHCGSYCLLPDSWLEAHSPFVDSLWESVHYHHSRNTDGSCCLLVFLAPSTILTGSVVYRQQINRYIYIRKEHFRPILVKCTRPAKVTTAIEFKTATTQNPGSLLSELMRQTESEDCLQVVGHPFPNLTRVIPEIMRIRCYLCKKYVPCFIRRQE